MKSVPFAGCHQKILRAGGNMKSIQHFPYTSEKYIWNCSTLFLPVLNLNGTIKLRFLCPGPATALALDNRVSPFSKKFSKHAANHFFITYGYPKWPEKSLSALAHKLISRWMIVVLVLELCSEIDAVCNFMCRHSFFLSKLSANALRQWVLVYQITT